MLLLEWDESSFVLGHDSMDSTHKEFVDMVNALWQASDSDFARLYDRFIEHTRQHFEQEELLMDESGFPATGEHKDEHQRILGELNQFKKRVDRGLIPFGRSYIKSRMPDWFKLHAITMDSALVAHLKG